MKKKVLIFGWYGHDNLGDDLLLNVIFSQIGDYYGRIYYTSSKPLAFALPNCLNIRYAFKRDIIRICRLLFAIDEVILGGGTYLHLRDGEGKKYLVIKLLLLAFAIILGKKVIFWGSGLGPFSENKPKLLLKFVLDHSRLFLRDQGSCNFVTGISKNRPELVLDPVYSLHSRLINSVKPFEKRQITAFALRQWPLGVKRYVSNALYIAYIRSISHFIKRICVENKRCHFIFLVFQATDSDCASRDDLVYSDILNEFEFIISYEYVYVTPDIVQIRDIYERFDILIGMRLHALILGIVFNKKIISISYDPKIYQMMKLFDLLEYNVNFDQFQNSDIFELWKKLHIQNYSDKKRELVKILEAYDKVFS